MMVLWTKQWYLIISGYFPKCSPSPTHVPVPGPDSMLCVSGMLPPTVPVSLCSFFPPHLPLDINRASGPSFPPTSTSGESSSESFKQVPVMLNCRRRRLSCHLSGSPMWIRTASSLWFHWFSSLSKPPKQRFLLHCPPHIPTPNDHRSRKLRMYGWLQGGSYQSYKICSLKRGRRTFTCP